MCCDSGEKVTAFQALLMQGNAGSYGSNTHSRTRTNGNLIDFSPPSLTLTRCEESRRGDGSRREEKPAPGDVIIVQEQRGWETNEGKNKKLDSQLTDLPPFLTPDQSA